MSFKTSLLSRWVVVTFFLLVSATICIGAETVISPVVTPSDAGQILAEGIAQAIEGNFDAAVIRIDEAAYASPDNINTERAAEILADYTKRLDQARGEREEELALAIEQVGWCMLAEEYLPTLAQDGTDEKLRESLKQGIKTYNKMNRYEAMKLASVDEAPEVVSKAIESLKLMRGSFAEAAENLSDRDGAYADLFSKLFERLNEQIDRYEQAWNQAQIKTDDDIATTAAKLKLIERNVAEALIDLESIVGAKPWLTALARAELAAELAIQRGSLVDQQWYVELTAKIESRGAEAIEQSKWYDALAAYAGLSRLAPDNEELALKKKIVRRHVRMLGLYGKDDIETSDKTSNGDPETKPAEPEDQDEPRWQQIVDGADAVIVGRAIQKLKTLYVKAVDFRKLARGGLLSIKVLAETPQVANTFKGLADEQKRDTFVKAVDRLLDSIQKRDRVGEMDLLQCFEGVLRASEETVEIPTEVLAVEFGEGLVGELDKFSNMIWPHSAREFRKHMLGKFTGVGISISKTMGKSLKVVTPLAGSPAHQAGVLPNDSIIAVDGKQTIDRSIDELVRSIMGPKGTKVILTIERRGLLEPIDIPIIREEITIRTVKGWRRKANSGEWDYILDPQGRIGYMRISQFTEKTAGDVGKVLSQLEAQGVESLILDLRFNPGGLLISAVEVTNQFVRSGQIVSTRGRQIQPSQNKAQPSGAFLDGNLVVLVNSVSASAAEIVSGALQDLGRATVVGQRSYGKGSVQSIITLRLDRRTRESLASLKLTTAYYYVGDSQRLLHRQNGSENWGVDPNVEVFMTPKQSLRWQEIRFANDLLQDVDSARLDENMQKQLSADLQLQTAAVLLKLMQFQDELAGLDQTTAMEFSETAPAGGH